MFLTGWEISWCQGIRGGSFRYWWHSIRCYLRGGSFQRIRSGIWWHCSFQEGKFYELESDQNEIGFFHLWMKVVFKWSMRRSLFLLQFDEGRNNFEGAITAEAVSKFVSSNRLPMVVEFTQEVFILILHL